MGTGKQDRFSHFDLKIQIVDAAAKTIILLGAGAVSDNSTSSGRTETTAAIVFFQADWA